NMAGRGTDIILGGNPETMAWARLKDRYPTRLDVPEAEWKALVDKIDAEEKMKEQGRTVAEMGGLHIIGTERHEARRIDNQLRGRAGRQGDPGSGRFYLSLQDDLMRIFAGEWVASVLTRLGMEPGQAIESKMVSRRIEAAQKKVEERNFDIRKNLLEYDEVMDHQRKKVYGFRQEVLDGGNCKIRVLEMIENQIDLALDRFLDLDYGAATFAEFAAKRLGVEFDANDFVRSDFTEAETPARNQANPKFQTKLEPGPLADKTADDIKAMLMEHIKSLYRQKEIEFPVRLGMVRFMSDRPNPGGAHGHRYDREGLMLWCKQRFPGMAMTEEDFRTLPRSKIHEKLMEVSQKAFPALTHDAIDAQVAEALAGADQADADDAK